MKLPDIVGLKKIRDASICRRYAEGESATEIASTFKINVSRVYKILYRNREYLKSDINWEKQKRIHWLKRQIAKKGDSAKDALDLYERLRIELEGEKPKIDQSQHTHIVFKWKDSNEGLPLLRERALPEGMVREEEKDGGD